MHASVSETLRPLRVRLALPHFVPSCLGYILLAQVREELHPPLQQQRCQKVAEQWPQ